jgi:hypothetical protein
MPLATHGKNEKDEQRSVDDAKNPGLTNRQSGKLSATPAAVATPLENQPAQTQRRTAMWTTIHDTRSSLVSMAQGRQRLQLRRSRPGSSLGTL